MPVFNEALDFYADDELAIMRQERVNRLAGQQRMARHVRADLKHDLALIGHELDTRRSAAQAHRQLINELCEEGSVRIEELVA